MNKVNYTVLIIVILLSVNFMACVKQNSSKGIVVTEGINWSLPEHVQLTPNSGLSWIRGEWEWVYDWNKMYPIQDSSANYFAQYIVFNWAEVNPLPDVYNFSQLDEEIERIVNSGISTLGFAFWPLIYARSVVGDEKSHGTGMYYGTPMIPEWLSDFSLITNKPLWLNGYKEVGFLNDGMVVNWDPKSAYYPALEQFLDTLGSRYKDNPKLVWVDTRYNDPFWGEGCLRCSVKEFTRATTELGLSPESLKKSLFHFVDIWARAFSGYEYKLVMSNAEPKLEGFSDNFADVSKEIYQYANKMGLGGRDGQVEEWNRYISEGYGISVDSMGYMIFDEEFRPALDGRVWYTENENNLSGSDRFGPDSLAGYRWFTSTMRLLQMRRNWVWISKKSVFKWPEITRYMQLSLGKTVSTSPDAWCLLRQGHELIRYGDMAGQERIINNFERWLYQRDILPDGMSKPASKVDISFMGQFSSARGFEYEARKTDVQSGNNCLYFKMEDRWMNSKLENSKLFVSYLDVGKTKWELEYYNDNRLTQTPEIINQNSGLWKTACFEIENISSGTGFPSGMDFRIKVKGSENLTVKLVRIVKWNE